jgi:hypothetical protein
MGQQQQQQHMGQQQGFRRPYGVEDSPEAYDEPAESESSFESESAAVEPALTPPETPAPEGGQAQPRRNEERPRTQFDRARNGGDQPRHPRAEDQADGWDGPQPQFLRRPQSSQGQPNGADRPLRDRRPMRDRGPRQREDLASPAEGAENSQPGTEPDTSTVN